MYYDRCCCSVVFLVRFMLSPLPRGSDFAKRVHRAEVKLINFNKRTRGRDGAPPQASCVRCTVVSILLSFLFCGLAGCDVDARLGGGSCRAQLKPANSQDAKQQLGCRRTHKSASYALSSGQVDLLVFLSFLFFS